MTLSNRLRALSRHEHSDLTIGDEAADERDCLMAQNAAYKEALAEADAALIAFADDEGGDVWGTVYAFNRRTSTYGSAISAARARQAEREKEKQG